MMPDGRAAEQAAIPMHGRILAIDIGQKRIGLAVSDPTQMIAQPLDTLIRRRGRRFPMRALRAHLDAHAPVGVVVGLALTPEGGDGEWAKEARAVAALVTDKTSLPVALVDERSSTRRALGAVQEMGGGASRRKGDVDQLAAVVILQAFLDRRRA